MDSARRPLEGTNRIVAAKPPPPPPVPVEPFERHVENYLREHAANTHLDTFMAAVGQRERAEPSVPMPPAPVAPPPLPPPLPPTKGQRERAATAHPLQGLLDLSQAPSLAPNVATSSVALAYFAMPPPPPPTQDQRERAAARSLLMPPPPVPIHRQKRRNPEPADDYSAKRRLFQSIFKPDDRAKGSADLPCRCLHLRVYHSTAAAQRTAEQLTLLKNCTPRRELLLSCHRHHPRPQELLRGFDAPVVQPIIQYYVGRWGEP